LHWSGQVSTLTLDDRPLAVNKRITAIIRKLVLATERDLLPETGPAKLEIHCGEKADQVKIKGAWEL
jgi:hypothetical protein